ncbi:fructose-specific PTS transporter subunit EIIC [Streptomyces sp. Je 1-4]|uniref:fructose-specific PTS transporter subunit EIIC n=1 Tax=Streptomyces explomaris TaxID=2981351 RepID=UPI0022056DB6|nr:fructose-specific PTS transporter subunit EIIC [Streptomyces sp. Je 1-4]UZQ38396.1 fructose-specific PTS transporter subunit EIIC [Streptomyces sp. Je 1-4] [Streptomyces sp. Je 1-4 4N24]UZQ45813.1 fructose-specific PTS transporter subunit EIIC [Streptomyces sp. Je 1-4] [Streptomyces sp. Je 1-4 4N24_ara]
MTACPTGIAHTYMAAEKLAQAARSLGHEIKVETQGSIGAENLLSDNDVRDADAVIIAADKDVDRSRFVGKRVLAVGVAEGIRHPEQLIERVRSAPVYGGAEGAGAGPGAGAGTGAGAAPASGGAGAGKERSVGYKALMNGVSYMIPFVVVGGLLIAISLALGGHPQADGGLVIPDGSFWKHVNDIGVIGFTLMVPILSGYIAYAIGDRPALVPGMIGGWIANTGSLYDSKAGAGFIGAIVTGFLAGYLVQWIKKVEVPKFARPIMPIIVIPIVATTALGLFFIYVIGRPISWVFTHLTGWLGGMTGSSAILLGALLGLMIAFDMGGPVNKTAFLFGAGLIASGNQTVMGMCAAAIPVMPLGQGLATLVRRRLYSEQERETGMAALFMGLFGISEGAIPFAAARPAQVIPANMLGGAVAGALAGMTAVTDAVPHGGPIVAVLGAVGGVPAFFLAVVAGSVVTALTTVMLVDVAERRKSGGVPAAAGADVGADAGADVAATGGSPAAGAEPAGTGAEPVGAGAEPVGAGAEPVGAGVGVGAGAVGGAGVVSRTAAEVVSVPPAAGSVPSVGGSGRAAEGSVPPEGGSVPSTEGSVPAQATASAREADGAAGDAAVSGGNDVSRDGTDRDEVPDVEVLSGYLTERTVKTQLVADEKEAAIREMAELLAGTGKVADVDELVRVALAREAQGTTGLGEEIAIPHAKTDAVTAPVVGFARSADGIDWGSLDGTRARLVFLISVPEAAAGDEHLRILALLSRKLMDADFRARLQSAEDEARVLRVLGEIQ